VDNLKQIRDSFRNYFDEPAIELPEKIELGLVKSIDLIGSGWSIKYKLDTADNKCFLDFYAEHRMTNSRHLRVLENGEVISLENFWEFGYTVYDDDQERTEREKNEKIQKNQEVEDVLTQKGFM